VFSVVPAPERSTFSRDVSREVCKLSCNPAPDSDISSPFILSLTFPIRVSPAPDRSTFSIDEFTILFTLSLMSISVPESAELIWSGREAATWLINSVIADCVSAESPSRSSHCEAVETSQFSTSTPAAIALCIAVPSFSATVPSISGKIPSSSLPKASAIDCNSKLSTLTDRSVIFA